MTIAPLIAAVCTFAAALWHPQQCFFISISYLLAYYAYMGGLEQRKLFLVLTGLLMGGTVFLAYKHALPFEYHDRFNFMLDNLQTFLVRNIIYAPIAFTPVIGWFLLMAPPTKKAKGILWVWLAIMALVSLMTTDVTRVMTIISLPVVLLGARKLIEEKHAAPYRNTVVLFLLVLLVPAYSWSGLDWFLWDDLLADLCKWGYYCQNVGGK